VAWTGDTQRNISSTADLHQFRFQAEALHFLWVLESAPAVRRKSMNWLVSCPAEATIDIIGKAPSNRPILLSPDGAVGDSRWRDRPLGLARRSSNNGREIRKKTSRTDRNSCGHRPYRSRYPDRRTRRIPWPFAESEAHQRAGTPRILVMTRQRKPFRHVPSQSRTSCRGAIHLVNIVSVQLFANTLLQTSRHSSAKKPVAGSGLGICFVIFAVHADDSCRPSKRLPPCCSLIRSCIRYRFAACPGGD